MIIATCLSPGGRRYAAPTLLSRMGAFACLLACLSGCSREPFKFVEASGRLTYEDGAPLPVAGGLRIVFKPTAPPVNGEMYAPSAYAYPDADGRFGEFVSSHKGGGLVRGEQKVVILYQDVDSKRFVPKQYTSHKTTPLVINTDDAPFEIKVPRPY